MKAKKDMKINSRR